ncbi:hypothetical protein Tco_0925131 [Tanacetum coccineum]|uniref:Retroviral polymerase SH3-like domain-containing protein n=1 Tax=Tanacetum coccineum TaxID=301880 RepID=A0ABQ5D8L9_9ASTR
MHDDVQPNYVVDSHADYTSDSNMIPYDQYVKDNARAEFYMQCIFFSKCSADIKFEKRTSSVKLQLASTINHNKSMVEEVTSLKKDFKQKENKYIEEFLDMKDLKEKEEIDDKMKDRMLCNKKVLKVTPLISERILLATFTPQKQLTPEQIFWSQDLIKMKAEALKTQATASRPIKALMVYPPNTPSTLVLRVLPTKSQVKINIFALIQLFSDFEKTCKKRITPTGLTEGEKGFEQTKKCYLTDVIPFFKTLKEHFEGIQKALTKEVKEMKDIFEELEAEVDQHVVDRKHDEIEGKNLLIANDNSIADCLFKDMFYIATNSELTISRFTEMYDAHTIVQAHCLELEAELSKLRNKIQQDNHNELVKRFSNLEVNYLNLQLKYQNLKESFGNNTSPPARDVPDFDSVFITRARHLEQTTALLTENESLKVQIQNKLSCVTKDHVKPKVLAPGKYAIEVEPIPPRNRNNREVHLDYLKHLKESVETLYEIMEKAKVERPLDSSLASACLYTKHSQELLEYVIGTCPKDLNTRDKKHASTPVTKKKQVTFEDLRVNTCADASGSQPRSNTKKNRILPAKSVNKKKVEEYPRTNKSSLKTTNHVDSSISFNRTVINSNSHSACKTCNKCLISANHDMCVVNYLHSVNASPFVKNVIRKVKQVWKPKQVRQVWKPIGKVLTNIGYQWRLTGRQFTLGEEFPLTRFTKPKVVPAEQTKNVSTSKYVITKQSNHTSQKPLTRYQRKNQQSQAVPASLPTLPENQAIAYANQQEPNQHWGSNFPISPSLSVFKSKFGNSTMMILDIRWSYAPSRKGYRIYNKKTRRIMETIHMQFDELTEQMAPVPAAPYAPPTNKELEILFQPMFDEYMESLRIERLVSPALAVSVPVNSASTPSSTTIDQDAPSLSHSLSSSAFQSLSLHTGIAADSSLMEDNPFAHVDNHPFINVFAPEPSSEASSSGDLSSPEIHLIHSTS